MKSFFDADDDSLPSSIEKVFGSEFYSNDDIIKDESPNPYVPLRDVFEFLGCEVVWESANKRTKVKYLDKYIYFDAKATNTKIKGRKLYVPIKMIEDILDYKFGWDSVNEKIIVEVRNLIKERPLEPITENSSFAEKLNQIMPKDKNYVFSPLSFKYVLAIVANGADKDTKAEITKVLNIKNLVDFNNKAKEFICKMQDISENDEKKQSESQLVIANSAWLNCDYINGGDFSEEFKTLVADKYKANMKAVKNETAVDEINRWCSEKTNGKINEIIENSDFISCFINAVYFKAKWRCKFRPNCTYKDDFTDRNGNKKQIDFMRQTWYFDFYQDSSIKIVYLPYKDKRMGMYIALTDDKPTDFEKYVDKLKRKEVELTIPKFKIEFSTNATKLMNRLGINYAFDANPQTPHFAPMFNNIVNDKMNVYMNRIIQKTYISIDEEGTETSAATEWVVAGCSFEEIFEFKADKPFTYFIRDNVTGEILFMGEYAYTN